MTTKSEYKFINVLGNLSDYSEVRVTYDAVADMIMGLSEVEPANNDFELMIGGYDGIRTEIRRRNQGLFHKSWTINYQKYLNGKAYLHIKKYSNVFWSKKGTTLSEKRHTWPVYDNLRKNFVLRILDGAIQYIINNEETVFLEFNHQKITKSDLKVLRISSQRNLPDEPHSWTIQPKNIPTGCFYFWDGQYLDDRPHWVTDQCYRQDHSLWSID